MTIEIKGTVTKEKVQDAIDKLSKDMPRKTLRNHFGKLKRNIDSLDYQKKVRDEWIQFRRRYKFFD
jgi:hypothetical protein